MYRFTLLIVAVMLLTSSVAQAASYQKRDGTVVDPILYTWEDTHSYSGNNLEPNAYLPNANLPYANLTNANLSDANLSDANLSNANLWAAKLIGANLTGGDLTQANLYGANLTGMDLTYTYLSQANLTNANLSYANLRRANLNDANLTNANLTDANLTGAQLYAATFSTGTTLYDGQTVLQHGFDAASLQAYLLASPISAWQVNWITIIPEPASVFLLLTGLLTLARVRF